VTLALLRRVRVAGAEVGGHAALVILHRQQPVERVVEIVARLDSSGVHAPGEVRARVIEEDAAPLSAPDPLPVVVESPFLLGLLLMRQASEGIVPEAPRLLSLADLGQAID